MDKTFSPSYFPSQITYVETEAVGFSLFRFHRKRTASSFHIPGGNMFDLFNSLVFWYSDNLSAKRNVSGIWKSHKYRSDQGNNRRSWSRRSCAKQWRTWRKVSWIRKDMRTADFVQLTNPPRPVLHLKVTCALKTQPPSACCIDVVVVVRLLWYSTGVGK